MFIPPTYFAKGFPVALCSFLRRILASIGENWFARVKRYDNISVRRKKINLFRILILKSYDFALKSIMKAILAAILDDITVP